MYYACTHDCDTALPAVLTADAFFASLTGDDFVSVPPGIAA